MHPAYSIIFFTTASGAGYGLLILLGLYGAAGVFPPMRWFGLAAFGLAFGGITFGLVSSAFHLGHRERAWRGVTQWRSSWLSREAVSALLTYIPGGLFGVGWVFFEDNGGIWSAFGIAAAVLALLTVGCTAMIYASLRPIQRWSNGWVLPNYVILALASGAVWLGAVAHLFGLIHPTIAIMVPLAIVLAWALKYGYWRYIDTTRSDSTAGTATGLGRLGEVRLLDAPHTQENYLQREMGYQIARKHAVRLRRIAVLTGFAIPLALSLLALWVSAWPATLCAMLAALLHSLGVVIERWLFFAEAKHTVTLYYGAATA